jgi:hypothetical protein
MAKKAIKGLITPSNEAMLFNIEMHFKEPK